MPTITNKEKYTIRIRDVYVPVDNNYLEFAFSYGDNEISEYEFELLQGNKFFSNSIKNKKSALSLKKKQKINKEIKAEKVEKNDSKPISEVQTNLEGQ